MNLSLPFLVCVPLPWQCLKRCTVSQQYTIDTFGNTLDPTKFVPDPAVLNVSQWVSTAKAMGARVAVLTSKVQTHNVTMSLRHVTRFASIKQTHGVPWVVFSTRKASASGRRSTATSRSHTARRSATETWSRTPNQHTPSWVCCMSRHA